METKTNQRYWKTNVRLIVVLLAIWAVVSLGGGILFIETLNQFKFGKIPLGFWIANQGSMVVFVGLILVYAVAMDWVDRRYQNWEDQHDD